jgi:lipopolysaccharide biosynthesis glycosyltransferase
VTLSCICYSTDRGYLYPTFLSALQARAQSREDQASVCIVAIDLDAPTETLFRSACARENILFIPISRERIRGLKSTFCRLFLDELLPPEFDRILYIDGDTQIRGSLDDLLDTPLGSMQVMGASDPMAFLATEDSKIGRELRTYMFGLGFTPQQLGSYFNAGVLYAGREGWAALSAASLRFFEDHRALCKFLDQSALNAVSRLQHVPMSLRWNFPAFLMNCNVEAQIRPVIYHFMSNPRPWNGSFPPWTKDFVDPYIEMEKNFPEIAAFRPAFSSRQYIRYHLQQRYKKVMETVTWRWTSRRRALIDYEAQTSR